MSNRDDEFQLLVTQVTNEARAVFPKLKDVPPQWEEPVRDLAHVRVEYMLRERYPRIRLWHIANVLWLVLSVVLLNVYGGSSGATFVLVLWAGSGFFAVTTSIARWDRRSSWHWKLVHVYQDAVQDSVQALRNQKENREREKREADEAARKAIATAQARREKRSQNARAKRRQELAPRPEPLAGGVSHRGAEHLCTQWMRHLGQHDAAVTNFANDGGIDVESSSYIAQVKNYRGTVGVRELRELLGVATVDGRKPLFFTSGSYSSGAVSFADSAAIALFVYKATSGEIHGVNSRAVSYLSHGLNS